MNNKKAFSIVEIIIAISIITLLAVIWTASMKWYDETKTNTKVLADTTTINNALESYSQVNSILPIPGWNINFYWIDTTYTHSYEDLDTYWVYGALTENTLAKKYLDVLPLDPRTNSYYSYGKTKETNQFEIASVQIIDSVASAKVIWNYTAETGPYNLIREYNWKDFVYNRSEINLPYNPEELILIVTDENWNIYREWDTITTTTTPLEIYFSDWSTSILDKDSKLTLNKLNFPKENNLSTIVKLALWAGTIWTKATHLNDESEFEVYTTDSTAAVRWTLFSVSKDTISTKITVIEWKVEINNPSDNINWENILSPSTELIKWWNINTIIVNKWENPKTIINNDSIIEDGTHIEIPIFIESDNYRSDQTESQITEEKCNTFEIDWECIDSEANHDLINSWFNLVAYAPYNKPWDLNLYSKSWITNRSTSEWIIRECWYRNWYWENTSWIINYARGQCNLSEDKMWWWNVIHTSWWANLSNNIIEKYDKIEINGNKIWIDSSFIETENWEKWIYIESDKFDSNNDWIYEDIDFLKYSDQLNGVTGSGLVWDFAIEMRILNPNENSIKKYLLTSWNDIQLYIKNWYLIFNNYWWTEKYITYLNNWFTKIILKKKNWILEFIVWNNPPKIIWHTINNNINKLYIWTLEYNWNYYWQLNSIIDYIKIYK